MPIPELDPLCFFPENSSSLTRSDHYNVLEFARDIALHAGSILILKKYCRMVCALKGWAVMQKRN